jgi:hypothetical protein
MSARARRGGKSPQHGSYDLSTRTGSRALQRAQAKLRKPSRRKYCHNGSMAFAPGSASACRGVHDGDDGPFCGPLKRPVCRGKAARGPGSAPFGGSDGLVCFFLSSREVLPQRGHGPRLELRRWLPGDGCVARPGVREHHRSSFAEMPCRAHRRKFSVPASGDRLCAQIVKEVARVVSR